MASTGKGSLNLFNIWNPEKLKWFGVLLHFRASVLPAIFPRVGVCGLFALLISWLHYLKYPVALPSLSLVVPSIVLGLLLVFRTNTAYERFWEGRKLWGALTNTTRNFTRTIWVAIQEKTIQDQEKKREAMRLVVAFAVATKLHLRSEPVNEEVAALIGADRYEKLKKMNHPPLEIAFWLGDYLQDKFNKGCIDAYQLTALYKFLDSLVDVLGGCERILKTPIPLAYSIHLKQLLMLYCLTLPFQVVRDAGWWSVIIVSLISFAVFGIEEIGIEIENPFGHDANDLPLDTICNNMKKNLEDLMSLEPSVTIKIKTADVEL